MKHKYLLIEVYNKGDEDVTEFSTLEEAREALSKTGKISEHDRKMGCYNYLAKAEVIDGGEIDFSNLDIID